MANDILNKKGEKIHLDVAVLPGEVLGDELRSRNMTKSRFALDAGLYPAHIGEIISGKRNITANVALKLEKVLCIPAEFWLGLQMDYDLYIERHKLLQLA